ncbi:cytosolic endo-beta-N-acetylglucosaminidase [Culicoides brevitarsis]|uniref:cytosolic endo-beta-N-acetylglucosaminidase n=1 Tax=Culicoides brevitarsis TaxID=469753 RepID=UPI00307BB858
MFKFETNTSLIILASVLFASLPVLYVLSDWERKHRATKFLNRKLNLSLVCMPLRTLDELVNFYKNPVPWKTLVKPLTPRTGPIKFKPFTDAENDGDEEKFSENRREILVCHDFKGNYREDSYISEASKWDGYRFYNWYGIDIFCYFSHDLVSVPTLQYINAAHKHGVAVLGTFIAEFAPGRLIMEKVLESREKVEQIADSLVLVAKYCGFEGWLMNIECPIEKEKVPLLVEFLEYLTARVRLEIPNGRVIWYDSVTIDGNLLWQNQVNSKNLIFFEKSDGIFLNYNWSDQQMQRTLSEVERFNRFKDVFVGIDVFGRGQVAKLQSHKTFQRIPEQFSVALFATGWTLESIEVEMKHARQPMFTQELNSRFLARDRLFWGQLWPMLTIYGPNQLPFYTSFCIGSGEFSNRLGMRVKRKPWFDLRKQEIQPCNPELERCFEDSFDGGSCLSFEKTFIGKIERLFVCDLGYVKNLLVSVAFKRNYRTIDLNLILKLKKSPFDKETCWFLVEKNYAGDMEKVNKASDDDDVRSAIDNLQNRGVRHLPFVNSINGWEVRHHLLRLYRGHTLNDIGIKIIGSQEIPEDAQLLLGALSIHEVDL